jgi:hypothetical protein
MRTRWSGRFAFARNIGLALCVLTIWLLPARESQARFDPLRYVSDQLVRADIVIILDTSLSMLNPPKRGGKRGSDCGGTDLDTSIEGDHICDGQEQWGVTTTICTTGTAAQKHECCRQNHHVSSHYHWDGTNHTCVGADFDGTISSDCHILDDHDLAAGSSQRCAFVKPGNTGTRIYMVKRAMQNVLRDFRTVGNFGLISLTEKGYFRYRLADTTKTQQTGMRLYEWDLRSTGSFTGGNGWEMYCNDGGTTACTVDRQCGAGVTCGRPASSFTTPEGLTMTMLPSSVGVPNALYRRIGKVEGSIYRDASHPLGACTAANPCNHGEGDCNGRSNRCVAGTVCVPDAANILWEELSVPAGVNKSTVDLCLSITPVAPNNLGRCKNSATTACTLNTDCPPPPDRVCLTGKNSNACQGARGCVDGAGDCAHGEGPGNGCANYCYRDAGANWWSPTLDWRFDVCGPLPHTIIAATSPSTMPSNGIVTGEKFFYKRFNWQTKGYTFKDTDGTWQYVASYYTYTAYGVKPMVSAYSNYVGKNQCAAGGCGIGEGGCGTSDSKCQAGLKCMRGMGHQYLVKAGIADYPDQKVGVCSHNATIICKDGADCGGGNTCDHRTEAYKVGFCEDPKIGGVDKWRYEDSYRGPRFREGGNWWVYNRYGSGDIGMESAGTTGNAADANDPYGIYEDGRDGRVVVPLYDVQLGSTQADLDINLGKLYNALNYSTHGGLHAHRLQTPTDSAMLRARLHFAQRQNPSVAISGDYTDLKTDPNTYFTATDPAWNCRPRFVLILSDGACTQGDTVCSQDSNIICDSDADCTNTCNSGTCSHNGTITCTTDAECANKCTAGVCSHDGTITCTTDAECANTCDSRSCTDAMKHHALKLYNDFNVTTLAMTLPGTNQSGIDEMNLMADCGDDGDCTNGSASAYLSNSEADLVNNLKAVFFEALKGEYATAPAGVATSGEGQIEGDVALTPSIDYPGWKGHLVANDLRYNESDPKYLRWDAGSKLQLRDWKSRDLYCGRSNYDPGTGTGSPFRLYDAAGNVDRTNIRAVWAGAPASDPELDAFIQWLGGKDRAWKLGPILRAVPAFIGPPPAYGGGHGAFETAQKDRQRLVYVPSNEGFIHAFDNTSGEEQFAYFPPRHFDAVYDLYKAGGQKSDPRDFKYILASSSRVEDIYIGGAWKTILIQTDGPGSENFTVLDITDPSTCVGNPLVCTTKGPPVKVLFTSETSALGATFGETWSVPTIFWSAATGASKVAMGSGYDAPSMAGSQGEHYNLFSDLSAWAINHSSHHQSRGAPLLHYGLVANTVATSNDVRVVQNTYQADLEGRVYRHAAGSTAALDSTKLVDLTANHPIHFSPASFYDQNGSGHTFLAINSGAYQDTSLIRNGSGGLKFRGTATNFKAGVFLHEDTGAATATDLMSCDVDSICTCGDFVASGGSNLDTNCAANEPGSAALPVTSPVLLYNTTSSLLQAFYLLYEPPTVQCTASGDVALGNSYVVVVERTAGGLINLRKVIKHENVQATGLTILGGGKDIGIHSHDQSSGKTTFKTVSGGTIAGALTAANRANIETWREVR